MTKTGYYFFLIALAATALAYPSEENNYHLEETDQLYRPRRSLQPAAVDFPEDAYQFHPEEISEVNSPTYIAYEVHRPRRSLQPGAPSFPGPKKQNGGWEVSPGVSRDDRGNTKTNVEVQNKGKNHDFNAGWGKVVRGPGKAKPIWHVGGTYRW